jgi:hypothetical protein
MESKEKKWGKGEQANLLESWDVRETECAAVALLTRRQPLHGRWLAMVATGRDEYEGEGKRMAATQYEY